MTLAKTVDSVAGSPLIALGFRRFKRKTPAEICSYARTVGDFDQWVSFERNAWEKKAIRFVLGTTPERDFGQIEARHLIPANIEADHDSWLFETDESLRSIVQLLVDIVVSHGISWLDRAITNQPAPPIERVSEMFRQPSVYSEQLSLRFGLNLDDPECLTELERRILRASPISDTPDWDLLIQASAYYGEFVRSRLGGQWCWNSNRSSIFIRGVGNKESLFAVPLRIIVFGWHMGGLDLRYSPRADFEFLQRMSYF